MKSFVLHATLPFFIIVLGTTNCLADEVDMLVHDFKELVCDFREAVNGSTRASEYAMANLKLQSGEAKLQSKYGKDLIRNAAFVVSAEFNELGVEQVCRNLMRSKQ